VCALLLCAAAHAQLSAQVSVASDYVYRGVSLDDGRPTVMAAADYDSATGWFVGGQVGQTRLYGESHTEPLWIVDAGYAHALTSRLSWEIGATYSIFTHFSYWNYAETFVGLSAKNWNLRLYYAPNYFGRQSRSTYLEFNLAQPLNEHLRLIGHLGAQRNESANGGSSSHTIDASVGAGARFDRFDLQLLRVAINRADYAYPVISPDDKQRWVLSAAYAF
jgi:uncharacterized protein (TIGR02001 family)